MGTVRLRIAFDHILNKSQKTKSLDRCWVLLKPEHQTISDLSSYILHAFNLQHDCPSGILLSMEDFVLPPFESTSILKDKDIIRVEKSGGVSSDILMIGNEANYLEAAAIVETEPVAPAINLLANEANYLEAAEIVETEPAAPAMNLLANEANYLEAAEIVETEPVAPAINLLANEEFVKESGGYQCEEEEDAPEQGEGASHVESTPEKKSFSKKREASKELKSPKRKKSKSSTSEDCKIDVKDIGTNVNGEQNGSLRTSNVNAKRLSPAQENSNRNLDASHSPKKQKYPSRSARRKRTKRRLLKEKRKKELRWKRLHGKFDQRSDKEVQPSDQITCQESGEVRNREVVDEFPEKGTAEIQEYRTLQKEDSDAEEDVVPIVVRAGHIRFVPLGKEGAEQTEQQNQIPVDNFVWNGVTSKKKGQKWGREKTTYKRNNHEDVNQKREKVRNGVRHHLNFENLEFYTTLPKAGDVIAYRLIELSPSWIPELSSYRVGKISRYDMKSNRVRLLQVPEYPIFPEELENDASASQSEPSPYSKDGSLWIEFSSLIEVRLVSRGKSNSEKSVTDGVSEPWIRDQETEIDSRMNNGNDTHASSQENGTVNPWEEISQAPSVKKEQLSQEDNWNNGESSSGRRPWSYRALRGSAMGPTMAFLRAQNEI